VTETVAIPNAGLLPQLETQNHMKKIHRLYRKSALPDLNWIKLYQPEDA
tara:strand:+ start:569 stop:715 length:147 start_codon:yes stop_codon:yes gene_type:complete